MGIMHFEKNKIDLDRGSLVTWTITDSVASDTGESYANYLRDRSNDSGWATTGSTDAANTRILCDFGESHEITNIFLVKQNWKAYTCKYLDGSSYVDFSTPINVSGNTTETKRHSFDAVETRGIEIVITGTMTPDDDKRATQIIVTDLIGDWGSVQPHIADIRIGRNRRLVTAISGRRKVQLGVGAVGFKLSHRGIVDSTVLTMIERLHDYHNGFLTWLCGGTSRTRIGYRLEDFYLTQIASEYRPEFNNGRFSDGVPVDLELWETL